MGQEKGDLLIQVTV